MNSVHVGAEIDVGTTLVVQQRVSSSTGGLQGRLDPDVASLSLCVDQHMAALTKDAVDHLLAAKARLLANMEAAVEQENEEGNKRLQTKQAEVEATAAELQHTQTVLAGTEMVLDRVAGGYAAKQRAVYDRLNLLRSWYVWREWAHKERRLQYLGFRLQKWYVRRWLLGRAWDRWLGQARLQYRTLVAERAEKQQRADAAALHAIHAKEAGALRAEINVLQAQLQEEAAARNKMEEEMKRSFMRGVTAINLEALQMMRRGAPPSGANPFPVAVPLNPATAAAGLVAAGGGQLGSAAESEAAADQSSAGAAAGAAVNGVSSSLRDWGLSQQQQQAPAVGVTGAADPGLAGAVGVAGGAEAAGSSSGWGHLPGGQPAGDNSAPVQAQSAYGAAAVVQLMQPQGTQRAGQSALSSLPGFVARSPASRVFVERGPGAGASPSSPQKGAAANSPQASRSVGARRSLGGADARAAARGAHK